MYVAGIRIEGGFTSPEVFGPIRALIEAWVKNGQVVARRISTWRHDVRALNREYEILRVDECYQLRIGIPAPNSLLAEHNSPDVLRAKAELVQAQMRAVHVDAISEENGDGDSCWCDDPTFYVLSVSDRSLGWNLRCGLCFDPVPRYAMLRQVPHSAEFDTLCSSWEADCKRFVQIYTNGSSGCRAAKKELSSLESSLTRRGREICDVITAGSGKPAYYYLYRDGGRSRQSEMRRRCPSCSGDWLLSEPMFDYFHFKCDRCRLLSNFGVQGA